MYSGCSRFHQNRFTFGGVIAERVNTAKWPRKVNPIFGRSLSSSRITKVLAISSKRRRPNAIAKQACWTHNISVFYRQTCCVFHARSLWLTVVTLPQKRTPGWLVTKNAANVGGATALWSAMKNGATSHCSNQRRVVVVCVYCVPRGNGWSKWVGRRLQCFSCKPSALIRPVVPSSQSTDASVTTNDIDVKTFLRFFILVTFFTFLNVFYFVNVFYSCQLECNGGHPEVLVCCKKGCCNMYLLGF